jgi:hypothetical protein
MIVLFCFFRTHLQAIGQQLSSSSVYMLIAFNGRTLHEGVPRTPVCAGTANFAEGEIFLRHCHTFALKNAARENVLIKVNV